jgi:hypothetical protein
VVRIGDVDLTPSPRERPGVFIAAADKAHEAVVEVDFRPRGVTMEDYKRLLSYVASRLCCAADFWPHFAELREWAEKSGKSKAYGTGSALKYAVRRVSLDFTKARDVTVQFIGQRNVVVCGGDSDKGHGTIRPVEFVDVTDVLPYAPRASWGREGARVILYYASDEERGVWYAELALSQAPGSLDETMGFAPMKDLTWNDRVADTIFRAVGVRTDKLALLYAKCFPDRLRRSEGEILPIGR